ncbi:hypothetical protein [Xenorhabdus indica]|uniref:hypothetical protein n=1 Tax=Xenorhabdus indica TaxID=333964 RepID=UPI001656D65C|nr:hypothetical protein [Xenorhabdus indica]MBC8943761.1 hypothetical protein [Xenorhabdus indica]
MKKINLYAMFFFIILIIFHNASAVELNKDIIIPNEINNKIKKPMNTSIIPPSYYFNLTFKNDSKYDKLNLYRTYDHCMYNAGEESIYLQAGEEETQQVEIKNLFGVPLCTGIAKSIVWTATTYFNNSQYKQCVITLTFSYNPFFYISGYDWYYHVNTESGCDLTVIPDCGGNNCLNNFGTPIADDYNITIAIKDDNNWEPPSITSPKPNSTVENNYITISGKGRNQDGTLPNINTSFNSYFYEVQPTGVGDNWEGQLWMPCGITGTVILEGIDNSGVTFNGPPCGETITSMQDGQTISAGKYSLSGRVNSDTADDAKRIQVQITGYNSDGTIYTPAKSYTPDVDTGTGEWRLDGLEAFCSIQYKASVFSYSSESQATHHSFLPEIPGKEEVSYSVQNCPPEITSPKPNSTVENNYITISGKGRNQDGTLPNINTSFNFYFYEVQPTGVGDNWEGQLWMPCGITGTVSLEGIDNSGVTFNGPPCGETITSMQDGQTISAGKYSLSGRVNSDTADDAKRIQVQITGYNSDGTIYTPAKSYTPDVDTGTGEWKLDGLEAVCFISYKAFVLDHSSELQSTHQSFLPSVQGKKEVSYSAQNCPVKITKPENNELISSTTQDTQNILIEGQAANGSTVNISYKHNDYESPSYSVSPDNNNWRYEIQRMPVGFIMIRAVGRNISGESIPNNKDEVKILSSKVFSVKIRNDSVFTEFYGTSMPTIKDDEENLMSGVELSFNRVEFPEEPEEIVSDENGNWTYEYKHYAKRGEYLFTFQESSDNYFYQSRGGKTFKCIGSDRGMNCINKN